MSKPGATNGFVCIDLEVLLLLRVVVCEGVDGTRTSLTKVLGTKQGNGEFVP